MASLPLTIAKDKRFSCLLGVNRKITALRDICDNPEKQKQEQDRVSTATVRLEEAWRKYEEGQQDVLGLVAEDQIGNELVIFLEMEKIYEAAIDKATKIIKESKEAREARRQEKQMPLPRRLHLLRVLFLLEKSRLPQLSLRRWKKRSLQQRGSTRLSFRKTSPSMTPTATT